MKSHHRLNTPATLIFGSWIELLDQYFTGTTAYSAKLRNPKLKNPKSKIDPATCRDLKFEVEENGKPDSDIRLESAPARRFDPPVCEYRGFASCTVPAPRNDMERGTSGQCEEEKVEN